MERFIGRLGAVMLVAVLAGCGGGGSSATDSGPATGNDTVTEDVAGGSDVAAPDGGGGSDDAGTESDTGGSTGDECVYTSDCNPPATACFDGTCVGGCPDNPCPEGWFCVGDTGTCIQECVTDQDCAKEAYWCEGRRCVAGCPWHPCRGDTDCDPISGYCTQSFCQPEVQPNTDRLWFGPANPDEPMSRSVSIRVLDYVPFPVTIDLAMTELSDTQVQLTDVVIFVGEDPVPIELPYEAQPGETIFANVLVAPESTAGAYGELHIDAAAMICGSNPVKFIAGGTPTCFSSQPAELDAGVVAVGDVITRKLRLRNDCSYDITLQVVSFISAFSDWSPIEDYGGTIVTANGGIQDVVIYFAPTLPGIRNTQLLVITDDLQNRVLQTNLLGQGAM